MGSEQGSEGPRMKREVSQSGCQNALCNRVLQVFGNLKHFELHIIGERVLDAKRLDESRANEANSNIYDVRRNFEIIKNEFILLLNFNI